MYAVSNFQPRDYQLNILETCKINNTLVILPTGLGKTKIAIMLAVNRLNLINNSKILILTPTKPLAEQIGLEIKNSSNIKNIEVLTGLIPPEQRKELWKKSIVIVSTPQGLTNDLMNEKISLEDISLLVIDEAHRSIGDYDYVWIASQYNKKAKMPRILALTASPGSDNKKIKEICNNLFIDSIEIRHREDEDVKKYVQDMNILWLNVDLPEEFKKVKDYLDLCYKSIILKLKNLGLIGPNQEYISKTQTLDIQRRIQGKLSQGEKDIRLWQGISLAAQLMKVQHAQELLGTQNLRSLHNYLNEIISKSSKVKANKNLAKDVNFKSALIQTNSLIENEFEHPKIKKIKELVLEQLNENKNSKILIFNHYRESASLLEKELNKIKDVNAKLFVGQTKKSGTGLSQKEQMEIIGKFSHLDYNVLISTSIGEEGLDIPQVDLVIFYEPVPSAIRSIQRRGRTARLKEGKVLILITKGTSDEAYHWSSFNKEKKMYKTLKDLKDKIKLKSQLPLTSFQKKEFVIVADHREKNSPVLKNLIEENAEIELKQLEVADYILSNKIGIERKTVKDFVDSIVDQRLMKQMVSLKDKFEKPLLIIEGTENIYEVRNVHKNAIQGALSSIALDFNIPILYTKDSKETASLIKNMALRENKKETELQKKLK
ncbi:MAG: ERCC4 domain-containing protein [Candidatus Nanoarchaeia archaeon]|nr:ERCC4 domain-containing protein [Candidatus Nanoarchaeia archaeon]